MSTATHGYSDQKMTGRPNHNTVHNLGSSKAGQNVILKSLAEHSAIPSPIVSVTQSKDGKFLSIEVTSHSAKVGDVFRIYSGVCDRLE